jgi:phage baseplate assembly protein W
MSNAFLGTGWKFPIEVDETTGKIKLSHHEEDIQEAIRIILWTSKGERVMRPDFGCGVQNFVFGLTDSTTLSLLESNIKEAITQWEPRVHEIEVTAALDGNVPGKLLVTVQYVVRSTNNLYNLVYPFYLHEGPK